MDYVKKRGRGRPRKSDEDAKRRGLHIRLSNEDDELLNELSTMTGRTKTELIMKSVKDLHRYLTVKEAKPNEYK